MIKPIVFTAENDVLEMRHDDKRVEDSALILSHQEIGRHHVCWGRIFFLRTSLTHQSLYCAKCGLRVVMKALLEKDLTYRGLRRYFSRRPSLLFTRFKNWITVWLAQ